MPTNRRYRTRAASLAPALAAWAKTPDADKLFGDSDEKLDYYGTPTLKELLRPPPWICPIPHIWQCHVDGDPDCGHSHHASDGRCRPYLATLIELHEIWSKKR